MPTQEKADAVAELADLFRASNAAVLTEYRGLTVSQLTALRVALGANATYAVVKNTLTKIAAEKAGFEGLDPAALKGPTAIAFVTGDPVEAAKGLRDFGKDAPALVIKGGVLDGRPIDADGLRKLADLEPREVLLAKLAGAPFLKGLFYALLAFGFSIAWVFLFAWIINALAPSFGAQKNYAQALKTTAYSPTAGWAVRATARPSIRPPATCWRARPRRGSPRWHWPSGARTSSSAEDQSSTRKPIFIVTNSRSGTFNTASRWELSTMR